MSTAEAGVRSSARAWMLFAFQKFPQTERLAWEAIARAGGRGQKGWCWHQQV